MSENQINALTVTAPHERVSSKYRFISSGEFVADMQSNGWDLVNTFLPRSKNGLGKHAMRFRSKDERFKLPNGDFLEIVVLNSHDGSTAFRLSLGIYRLVCSNGLVVGKDVVPPVSIRHIGYASSYVKTAIARLLSQVETIKNTVDKLQSTQLTIEQYTAFINLALQVRGLKPHSVNAEQLHIPRREEDKGTTAWVVLNRIQEYAIQGFKYVDLTEHEVKTARRITGPAAQLQLNQRLFDGMVKIAA